MNYESPNHLLPHAGSGGYAENAHRDLSTFQEGLRATHEGETPSHNTLVGHSYGSVVAGEAAAHGGAHADEVVFLGSPGVGVDSASELGVPGEHVWVAKSDHDLIDWTPSTNPLDWGPTVFGGTDHTGTAWIRPIRASAGGSCRPSRAAATAITGTRRLRVRAWLGS